MAGREKKSLEDYRKEFELLLKERNGKIICIRRDNIRQGYIELNIECKVCGHLWWASPTRVRENKHWCKICSSRKAGAKQRKYDIKFFKDLALKRGLERTSFPGKCLSEDFKNVDTNLDWECGACLHRWSTPPKNILYRGSWCSKCANSFSEEICRKFFEALFFAKFPKAKKGFFFWLVNDDGNYIELDGHNKLLKIAFEYHGRQHYEEVDYFYRGDHKKFRKRLRDDQKRRELCEQYDYKLIEIGYEWRKGKLRKINFNQMENYIRKNCREKEINIPNQNRINWRKFQINHLDRLREMQDIAKFRNGELLSKVYFNNFTKLHWYHDECGTDWWATPASVKDKRNRKGTWCPKCGGTQKGKIEEMQELAKVKLYGGKCLSEEYMNNKTRLYWECGLCEHRFWRSPNNLKSNDYNGKCPNCLSIVNMPQSHVHILEYLKLKGGQFASDLAFHFKVPTYTIVAKIDREKHIIKKIGLIKREKKIDPRNNREKFWYSITQKCLKALKLREKLKILNF